MSKVTIYGSLLCPDTQEALKLLDEKKIGYDFKNISTGGVPITQLILSLTDGC